MSTWPRRCERPTVNRAVKRIRAFLLASLFVFALPAAAHGETPVLTLIGNGRAEYRFDYPGDRTPISIALDSPGAQALQFSVYAAAPDGAKPDLSAAPVGRGTPSRDHDLSWLGSFNIPGTYFVNVENHSPGALTYQFSVSGGSVSNVTLLVADTPRPNASWATPHVLTVDLPPGAGAAPLRLDVLGSPSTCTHASQMTSIISSSIKLCPNEIYQPLHFVGDGLALYVDDANSAIVTSMGRQFAVTMDGSYDFIEGITIQAGADSRDSGAWLCQYDECTFPPNPNAGGPGAIPGPTTVNGGIVYGGGILLRGSHSTIHGVMVHGGTIGIATVDGAGNALVDNRLSDLNGWGIFNLRSQASYFVGNVLNRENHGCVTPDGRKFKHGCETSGWVCLACSGNIIARNHCDSSANCFYMSGERGLASDGNRLVGNYCGGASDNCFEITFSRGNVLQDNITTADGQTGESCRYPFWIGGSTVYVKNNVWQCDVSADDALAQAAASTSLTTATILLDAPVAAAPAAPNSITSPAPSTEERIPRGEYE